jgi:predicted nucleic acid-binding protein
LIIGLSFARISRPSANRRSFTDCFNFIVMKELRLCEAWSKDVHFRSAGFIPVLA